MLFSSIVATLARLELAANILAHEEIAARYPDGWAAECVMMWTRMLAAVAS